MKKILVSLGLIVMCILQGVNRKADEYVTMENNNTIEMNDFVDNKLNEAVSSEEYKNMTLEERVEFAHELLLQLEQGGYIKRLIYDSDNYMYSFEYSDGILGGWKIEDFKIKDGLIPTN